MNACIGTSKFSNGVNDMMYVGYMYGTSNETEIDRSNSNNSTIKAYIDGWYKDNLLNYTKYLSSTAVYCNDRQADDEILFDALTRLEKNGTPTYDCTNESDAFSVSNPSAKLTYPIALMTADEVTFAGGVSGKRAQTYYYRNSSSTITSSTAGLYWWTMSPAYWYNSSYIYYVHGSLYPGYMDYSEVNPTACVRPVTSLKSCVKWKSGDGSADNPYTIDESYSC